MDQIQWLFKAIGNLWVWVIGLAGSIIGHLIPIKDIIHLLLFFFLLDVFFGYLSAKKLRGEKFNTQIIWRTTVPRIFTSLTLIIAVFMWDSVYYHDFFLTYKLLSWFFSGLLLISITKNIYNITRWNPFRLLGNAVKKQVETQTGINFEANEGNN